MEDIENYKGYLLAAHPKRNENIIKNGVVLVIDHDLSGAIGLQINKAMENATSLGVVMNNLGMVLDNDCPIYFGGPENTNRIIVVHTLDWQSSSTTEIAKNLGISNDLSVLAAISQNKGPKLFRAIAGFVRWLPTHLEAEIDMIPPWNDITKSWSLMEGSVDTVFNGTGNEQWHRIIEESAKRQIANWF